MQTSLATTPTSLARIHTSREAFTLCPSGANQLLVLLDPALQPEPVLGIVLEVAEQWSPQITLMYGGFLNRREGAARQTDQDALVDLVCLVWQLRGSYPEVSMSRIVPRSAREVFREASDRQAGLIIISETVAEPFRHSVSGEPNGLRSPCPIVSVAISGIERTDESPADHKGFR